MPARSVRRFVYLSPTVLAILLALAFPASAWAADTTPPTTYLNLSGTMGGNGWYTSTVDVSLRASDLESGPHSTTYQVDSGSPTTNTYTSSSNAVLNPSFEDGVLPNVNYWDPITDDPSALYQSSVLHQDAYRSVTIVASNTTKRYWTNANYSVPAAGGNSYAASVWLDTQALTCASPCSNGGAWVEVWGRDTTGVNSDTLLAQSTSYLGDNNWTLVTLPANLPSGYNAMYFKLGALGSGQVWFDSASMYVGSVALTQFTMVQNGSHTLSYYSTDNAGNTETANIQSPIKIDTVNPQDWSGFGYNQTPFVNSHTFNTWVYVRDVTSGINPPTAYFQMYDVNNCNCWTDRNGNLNAWSAVDSVTRQDNGQPAAAGYTGFVKLATNNIDYGNSSSSTFPQIRFTINDMATSVGNSPIYGLFNPWLQLFGHGDIFSKGGISISGTTPAGQYSADGMLIADNSIYNMITSTNWYVTPYDLTRGANTLADYIPTYNRIAAQAVSLPGNKLPSSSGIYSYTGNYTMDSNSITSLFQGNAINAIIIINGNLAINQAYTLNPSSAVAILVTGNITFANGIANTAGALIAAGTISDGSGGQLIHNGTLVGLSGLTLSRDLGRKGGTNNSNTPAEQIIFPVSYLANTAFAQLFSGSNGQGLTWQEVQ